MSVYVCEGIGWWVGECVIGRWMSELTYIFIHIRAHFH